MINELILRVDYQDTVYDLPVDSEVPLRVDMSSVEAGELGKFFGIGSQTFSLPGTKVVNKFFNYGYDVSQDDVPAMYNTIPCSVILNGETVLQGALQLISVVTSDDGYVTYNVQVYDKVLQFEQALASKLIKDGDWTAYNHILTSGSILESWNNNLLSGSVFYPLAEYGRADEKTYPVLPRIQWGETAGAGGVNSILTPLQPRQFLPSIRLKDALDVVFDQVGFTYTGSFTETEDFNNLYVLPKGKEDIGPVVPENEEGVFQAGAVSNQTFTYNIVTRVSASLEVFDPQNLYNTTTSEYTSAVQGIHAFSGQIGFFNPVFNDPLTTARVTLTLKSDTSTLDSVFTDYVSSEGQGPFYLTVGSTTDISAGRDVYMEVLFQFVISSGAPAQQMTLLQSATDFRCTEAPIAYNGATIEMGLQFQPDTKSIDFIKGVIQQFNLIMTPEIGSTSVIRIETFDTWMRQGEIKDWTSKFDTAKRIKIDHTVDELEKVVFLKNADDSDRFSKASLESLPNDQYGTLRLIADNNISQGETTIGDYFGPVVLGGPLVYNQSGSDGSYTFNIDPNSRNVHPHLYKLENNAQKAFMFKPRIGYKVTNQLQSGSYLFVGLPDGGFGNTMTEVTGSYSTLSNTSALPVVSGSTNDLHFNNTFDLFSGAGLNLNQGKDNFENYWKTYYDSLYWEGAKKVTLDLYFNEYEYKDIKLNDKILIKNQAYRINKISGFNISHKDVVTVELLKLYPAYWQL
jgi:hypothetical protein